MAKVIDLEDFFLSCRKIFHFSHERRFMEFSIRWQIFPSTRLIYDDSFHMTREQQGKVDPSFRQLFD